MEDKIQLQFAKVELHIVSYDNVSNFQWEKH